MVKFNKDEVYAEIHGENLHLYEQGGRYFSPGDGHQEMQLIDTGGGKYTVKAKENADQPSRVDNSPKPAAKPKAGKKPPKIDTETKQPADPDAFDLEAWARDELTPKPRWIEVVKAYKAKYGEPPENAAQAKAKILGA